ncbi:uncharacterized protein [Rutidosis leptorrhynchoides]|uniref:uncharacterized protein n=1 Tax=Rutidosis leptorrhynchoides TaxID=125765 RepID=UPI003A995C6A
MTDTIKTVSFSGSGASKWKFSGDKSGSFVTKSMAKAIDDKLLSRESTPSATIKNNLVPLKVGIFVWRTLTKRIVVKEELDRRGIDLDTLLCPICNDVVESVDHAIYSCKFAQGIWVGILKWWNLPPSPSITLEELIKYSRSLVPVSCKKKVWQAVVWVTCYLIWKNRNLKVFKNDAWATSRIVTEIQVKSFEWIKNRSRKSFASWHQWLISPSSSNIIDVNFDPG